MTEISKSSVDLNVFRPEVGFLCQLLFKKFHFIVGVDSLVLRASTKGRNLASVPVRRFLKTVFIRVHFVLRPVRLYILAIFWHFLGPRFLSGIKSKAFMTGF